MKERYNINKLRECSQGSTYVKFEDMIRIHLFESSSSQQIRIIDDRSTRRIKEVTVNRSWPILINILQTEDKHNYGTQFRSIPKFITHNSPSMVTLILFALLSSSAELWSLVDNKPTPFKWSGWEAWILTSIQKVCFQFDTIKIDRRSPIINQYRYLSDVINKVNQFYKGDLYNYDYDDASSYYECDSETICNLFNQDDYSSSIAILDELDEETFNNIDSVITKKAIIIVGNDTTIDEDLIDEYIRIGSIEFELRVICIVQAKERGRTPSTYDSIRYMRHGNGYTSWWKQERKDDIVTQVDNNEDILHYIKSYNTTDCYFKTNVYLYIKINDEHDNGWKEKFFESMGGNLHVRCHCHNVPLVPSHRRKSNKNVCNMYTYINEDGSQHQIQHECRRKELYICSNVTCNVKICKKCYDSLPANKLCKIISQPNLNEDDDEHYNDIFLNPNDTIEDEEETNNGDDDSSYLDLLDENLNEEEILDVDVLINSERDDSLDLSSDNIIINEGFLTTNAGDQPANVNQNNEMLRVDGHVIFNQVGRCTSRNNQTITGTSCQQYMVQSLCATTSGQSPPLLQPEASLFPRHFYISASHDECSILGAQPLFLLCSKTHPYGFSSVLDHARMHMTNPSSTTSTDPNFMCLYFDMLGNMVMNQCHSRDIFERGFVVDNSSSYGMSIRDKDNTKLSGSVDSRKMVLKLASSQKYIKYTWFLTFTANQSEHPGLSHLHEWKNSSNWQKNIPEYDSYSIFDKKELQSGMEQAYGVHLYNNWYTVKLMLLKHIKQHLTVLGTTTAIFARDEYQGKEGNISHSHLILAIDKRTMNGNAEKYVQDLIRTSSFETIKTDEDIDRLLRSGLLESVNEIHDISARANIILRHVCDDRCKMRVNVGKGDKDFRCRKMHSVKDSPNPNQHNYVPIKHKYQKATLDILKEVGIYIPVDKNNDQNILQNESSKFYEGVFTHPYFDPKRHIAPCNYNATCNMSPIIPDFFVGFKSMQNAQALDHTNGIAKYVCKYITKFDEGNYVVLC